MRTKRGWGRCDLTEVRALRYRLGDRTGWLDYLQDTPTQPEPEATDSWAEHFPEHTGQTFDDHADRLARAIARLAPTLRIVAPVRFPSGVLVGGTLRSGSAADRGHIHSGGVPVLPGTAVAGVLRGRARQIASYVRAKENDARWWVDQLFGAEVPLPGVLAGDDVALSGDDKVELGQEGPRPGEPAKTAAPLRHHASRVTADEVRLQGGNVITATRIAIDHFTRSTRPAHLVNEDIVVNARAQLVMELELPPVPPDPGAPPTADALCGLLLLAAKEILLGTAPIGGTVGVGRGTAVLDGPLSITRNDLGFDAVIDVGGDALESETVDILNGWVDAFWSHPPMEARAP
jgi:hypothetical protein